jgi:hypothetical protein
VLLQDKQEVISEIVDGRVGPGDLDILDRLLVEFKGAA